MEHSKTPWRIEPATKKDNWRIIAANNQVVSTFSGSMDMDNARRIVACVNACAGLDTDYLENVGLPEFVGKTLCTDLAQQELERVTAQRDQLLAALEELEQQGWLEFIVSKCKEQTSDESLFRSVTKARAVIQKVRGGE